MTHASTTCRLCGGKGWISVASHLCRGDDLACRRKCPDEHAVPCDACGPARAMKHASLIALLSGRQDATESEAIGEEHDQIVTNLEGLVEAWDRAKRSRNTVKNHPVRVATPWGWVRADG